MANGCEEVLFARGTGQVGFIAPLNVIFTTWERLESAVGLFEMLGS